MALFFKNKNDVNIIEEETNLELMKKENESLKQIVRLQETISNYSEENKKLLEKIKEMEENNFSDSNKNSNELILEKNKNKELIQKYNNLLEESRLLEGKYSKILTLYNLLEKKYNELEKKDKEVTNTEIPDKQWELMERNLKNARNENLQLKEKLSHYEEVGNEVVKIKIEEISKEYSQTAVILDEFKYKVSIEDFYPGLKFVDIRNILKDEGINFVNEIENFESILNIETAKNYSLGKSKFENYKKEIVSIEDRILFCKGSKISKIIKTPKKFVSYLADINMEFMDELDGVDIMALSVKAGVVSKNVKGIITAVEEYFNTNKIS